MNTEDELNSKLAEIAGRYLQRTVTELAELDSLIAQVPSEGKPALRRIEVLTHRIRGSGAVFGFQDVSAAAEAIEMLAVEQIRLPRIDTDQVTHRLTALARLLHDAVQRALQSTQNS